MKSVLKLVRLRKLLSSGDGRNSLLEVKGPVDRSRRKRQWTEDYDLKDVMLCRLVSYLPFPYQFPGHIGYYGFLSLRYSWFRTPLFSHWVVKIQDSKTGSCLSIEVRTFSSSLCCVHSRRKIFMIVYYFRSVSFIHGFFLESLFLRNSLPDHHS